MCLDELLHRSLWRILLTAMLSSLLVQVLVLEQVIVVMKD